MWGKVGWEVRYPNMPSCLGDNEDATTRFFEDLEDGKGCDRNWFSKALGENNAPTFPQSAPALLGFDESIASFCLGRYGDEHPPGGWERNHPAWCVSASINILALFDGSYNLCQNLKWQVCAAQGKLPGQQRGRTIKFARAPGNMPISEGPHPFGKCSGFKPKGCDYGYGTDDIYFLEVCLFSFLCENGDDLFDLKVAAGFQCYLLPERLNELRQLLTMPLDTANQAYRSGGMSRCENWCNRFTCNQGGCIGCKAAGTHGC